MKNRTLSPIEMLEGLQEEIRWHEQAAAKAALRRDLEEIDYHHGLILALSAEIEALEQVVEPEEAMEAVPA